MKGGSGRHGRLVQVAKFEVGVAVDLGCVLGSNTGSSRFLVSKGSHEAVIHCACPGTGMCSSPEQGSGEAPSWGKCTRVESKHRESTGSRGNWSSNKGD